jgi:hypothetical protein
MSRHHDPTAYAIWSHRDIRAVIELPHQGAFRAKRRTDQGVGASGSGLRTDSTPCSPCRAQRRRSLPDHKALPQYHIAHRAGTEHALLGGDAQRDSAGSLPPFAAVPPDTPRSLCFRTNRATDKYALARRRCGYGRLPHVYDLCNQGHIPHEADATAQAAPASVVKRVGERPLASHRCQRPRVRCLHDHQSPQSAALYSEGARADPSERAAARLLWRPK